MKRTIVTLGFITSFFVGALAFVPAQTASAINVFDQCSSTPDSAVCKAQGTDNFSSLVKTVVNTMLFILGAIAVIMIVIGGIRYTLSGGDASNTKAAKDTILYAVIGLVVAVMAYAIVNFVIGALKK
jgi:hypothetical protein